MVGFAAAAVVANDVSGLALAPARRRLPPLCSHLVVLPWYYYYYYYYSTGCVKSESKSLQT